MILQRLYELAVRERLLDEIAFEDQPVPFIVQIGRDGSYLGIQERRGELPAKKKDSKPKPDKGHVASVPTAHGNTANPGFARFFCDTLPRVLPIVYDEADGEKSDRSRATFWQQVAQAADEIRDPALMAVRVFGQRLENDAELANRIASDVAALKPAKSDRCTFAWDPDFGRTIVERDTVRSWYSAFFAKTITVKQDAGPSGLCQVTGEFGPIPTTHSFKLAGVPGGLPTGVSLISYDKAAFESYGLDGTANAGVGYAAVDGYGRALTALIQNKLARNQRTSFRLGNLLFLFWTRIAADTSFMNLFEAAPDDFPHLLESLYKGAETQATAEENALFILTLSGNAARAIVRDYLELPLRRAVANLRQWFSDLRIADVSRDGAGKPTSAFPLWQLAAATAFDSDQVAPDTPARLVAAALRGGPVSESLLIACLRRLRAEGRKGFRASRMALIKLILVRREIVMSDTLDADERNSAYLYGRLLAVFEQIQYAALGDINANVVDKFYGTFSSAPALVFSRLYANAQNHLRKLRGDKPAAHVALDRLLMEVTSLLPPSPPKGQLSLADQGRFALGYYHQRAKQFEQIADRKAAALIAADA